MKSCACVGNIMCVGRAYHERFGVYIAQLKQEMNTPEWQAVHAHEKFTGQPLAAGRTFHNLDWRSQWMLESLTWSCSRQTWIYTTTKEKCPCVQAASWQEIDWAQVDPWKDLLVSGAL